jgi:hypothetical protein
VTSGGGAKRLRSYKLRQALVGATLLLNGGSAISLTHRDRQTDDPPPQPRDLTKQLAMPTPKFGGPTASIGLVRIPLPEPSFGNADVTQSDLAQIPLRGQPLAKPESDRIDAETGIAVASPNSTPLTGSAPAQPLALPYTAPPSITTVATVIPEPTFGSAAPKASVTPVASAEAAPSVPTPNAVSQSTEPVPAERTPSAETAPKSPPPTAQTEVETPPLQPAVAIPHDHTPSAANAPAFTEDDELILQVETANGTMADTIVAYGSRTDTYLPVGDIARLLDLAIVVSDEGNYASGWALDPKRTLSINLRQGTMTVDGHEVALAPSDAMAFEGELYLKSDKFADLLPLTMAVNLRSQSVAIKTLVPFPFEERVAREQAREHLSGQSASNAPRHWPREETPYSALSFPLGDVELRAVSDDLLGSRLEGDLRVAGDLAYLTARLSLDASTRDGLTSAWLEMGRRDPDGELLGPLQATEFEMGDVSTTSLPMGLRGTSGRGAFVTNAPLEQVSVFDTIDFRGDLPDGNEVELYRNNVLIGSTRIPVNGRYEFLQVPVEFGINVFRLVFYGPQGQRREEVRRISVGDGRIAPGKLIYSLGSAQQETNLLNVYGPFFSPTENYGLWRSSALVQYGLNSVITTSLGGAIYDSPYGMRWLVTGGLRTGLAGAAMRLDLGLQSNDGRALEFGLAGTTLGMGYTLSHAEYRGEFTDEVRAFNSQFLHRATEFDLNTSVKLGSTGMRDLIVPITGRLRRIEYANGRRETTASLRGSLMLKDLLASNTINYSSTGNEGGDFSSTLFGSFDLTTLSHKRMNYRAEVDYSIAPDPRLVGGSIEADYALASRTTVKASLGYVMVNSAAHIGLSAVRNFDRFTLAFDGSYGFPDNTYSAGLRLGFSFGRNPLDDSLFVAQPGLAMNGAVAIRAYRDENGDGMFDGNDTVVPDLTFNTTNSGTTTNSRGIAFIGKMGDGNRASYQLDVDSLPDIDLAPISAGLEIVPRAGRIHVSEFGIIAMSEVEGTAYFSGEGNQRAVSGLVLRLLNANGDQVSRTRTEADGYFLFEQVQPGNYRIELDPGQAQSLKIAMDGDIDFAIGPKTEIRREVLKVHAN